MRLHSFHVSTRISLVKSKMESNEDSHVSGIVEDISNANEAEFCATVSESVDGVVEGVFVSSPELSKLLTTNPVSRTTTRVVIRDLSSLSDGIKTPTPLTPITPATPSTPGSAGIVDLKTGFRYTWDSNVTDEVLPVRCKRTNGQLHKSKFGSGSRGRCIKVGNTWFTPSEFEALGGRGGSKDWKRSIRYGGRAIQCLVEEGILQPHATSCTCANCCDDDETVCGPVRLFVPYKRRKLNESSNPDKSANEEDVSKSPPLDTQTYVTLTPTSLPSAPTFTISSPCSSSTTDPTINVGVASKMASMINFTEHKQWWQLEEMVNNLINCGQQLRLLLDTVKEQSISSRELALQQLRTQLEEEKNAVNILENILEWKDTPFDESTFYSLISTLQVLTVEAVQAEAENNLKMLMEKHHDDDMMYSKVEVIHDESSEANGTVTIDVDVSNKSCANCSREAFAECAGCHKVGYCSQFCQRKDWRNHMEDCERDDIILIEDPEIISKES